MTTGHYDELTWLDFVQEDLAANQTSELAAHLARCATCKRRVAGLRRLTDALPVAGQLLGFLPVENPTNEDLGLLESVQERADRERAADAKRDRDVATWFAGDAAACIPDDVTPEDVAAALRVARARLRTNPPDAGPILSWALDAIENRPRGAFAPMEVPLRTTFAQLLLTEGKAKEALAELDRAKPRLAEARDPELEEAHWHYVRAAVLHNRSQYDAALKSVARAAQLYGEWEDDARWRRARVLHAAILSDADRAGEALSLYDDLFRAPWPSEDQPLKAICMHNYACDLLIAGHLDQVRQVFARATDLWRKTGQEAMLFRVRCGLADLALAEKRYEIALAVNLGLRKEFETRTLPWDEVQRELRILELFVRLGRIPDARATCAALLHRTRELDLPMEAQRALAFLAQPGSLEVEPIARVLSFVKERSRNPEAVWIAA